MEKNCRKYYVFSDTLNQYVSNKDYFGVEKLDKELEKEGFMTSEWSLNKAEYFRQKVITPATTGSAKKPFLLQRISRLYLIILCRAVTWENNGP